jgi:hypothetical protein
MEQVKKTSVSLDFAEQKMDTTVDMFFLNGQVHIARE